MEEIWRHLFGVAGIAAVLLAYSLWLRWSIPRMPHRRQRTFVYCPTCKLEQIANGCFVEDADLVTYRCASCGTVTRWDFDAPAPILLYVNGEFVK